MINKLVGRFKLAHVELKRPLHRFLDSHCFLLDLFVAIMSITEGNQT